ncbi:MAG TPA: TIGR03619 family F420-dependent LLM class oxidoreductase [Bacillota bacterium]
MPAPRFGVLAPHVGIAAGPEALIEVARAAERLGFASLWVGDHIALPKDYELSAYPFNEQGAFPVPSERPFYEAFTTLGFLAAVTERALLGVSVCIVPYRPPLLLAKTGATLDALARGRLILGAGVGWLREEFAALGAPPFEQRGAFTDETLAFLRQAWAGPGPVQFSGRFIRVHDMYLSPQPAQGADLPIWIGGMGEAAWRRTARYGQAWNPALFGAEPGFIRRGRERIAELAAAEGRPAPAGGWGIALWTPMEFAERDPDPNDADALPWRSGVIRGTPGYIAGVLARYAEAGVDHVILVFGGSARSKIRTMERFVDEVLPQL